MWLLDGDNQEEASSQIGYYAGDSDVEDEAPINADSATVESSGGYVRAEEIAQFIGVGTGQIKVLTQEGVIKSEKVPYQGARMYHFLRTIRALIVHYREKASVRTARQVEPSPADEALKEAKLQEADLKVRRLQVQIELQEGKAHPTDLIVRAWGNIMNTFKMQLYNMPYVSADKFVALPDKEAAFELLNLEMRQLGTLLMDYDAAASLSQFSSEYEEDGDMIEEKREVDATIT